MFRLQLLFLTLLYSINVSATTYFCPRPESREKLITEIETAFNQADVVFRSSYSTPGNGYTSRHTVVAVWKGTVGLEPYVYDSLGHGLFFAKRSALNEPLTYTRLGCGIFKEEALKTLISLYGDGYSPNSDYRELPYSKKYLLWPIALLALILSVTTYVVSNFKLENPNNHLVRGRSATRMRIRGTSASFP
jgi:hypothetical protein